MKVVLIGPVYPYRGGIAHHTTLLARALKKRHDVLVISFRQLYPRWLYPGATDKDPSQHPLSLSAEFLLDPLAPWTWWQATRRIVEYQPAMVILPWWTTFLVPMTVGVIFGLRRARVRTFILSHNVLPHEPRPWDAFLSWLALRGGQAFITQTRREKERLLKLLPNASIEVVPHPVYDMFVEHHLSKAAARQKLNLPTEAPILLFFGIVRPYKGLKYLIEALAYLRDQGRLYYLMVAGEFWESRAAYDEQIRHLGLTERVRLFPYYIPNEEVGVIFSAVDMVVAPYESATQSGVIKLALGFGLPVITTRVAESEELEAWSKAGWVRFVSPKDPRALAEAVLAGWPACEKSVVSVRPIIAESEPGWSRLVDVFDNLIRDHP